MDSCIFCKIIAGKIPCYKLLETPTLLSFLDINPLAPAHVLVIPKAHHPYLHELSEEVAADCGRALNRISKALVKAGLAREYNVLQNNGRLAHQEVEHVHFHLIPKPDLDSGLGITWNSLPQTKEQLAQVHEKITNAVN
jgi:diadenosine tetraphosphate (Ap4A) HIT family hydrolase